MKSKISQAKSDVPGSLNLQRKRYASEFIEWKYHKLVMPRSLFWPLYIDIKRQTPGQVRTLDPTK